MPPKRKKRVKPANTEVTDDQLIEAGELVDELEEQLKVAKSRRDKLIRAHKRGAPYKANLIGMSTPRVSQIMREADRD